MSSTLSKSHATQIHYPGTILLLIQIRTTSVTQKTKTTTKEANRIRRKTNQPSRLWNAPTMMTSASGDSWARPNELMPKLKANSSTASTLVCSMRSMSPRLVCFYFHEARTDILKHQGGLKLRQHALPERGNLSSATQARRIALRASQTVLEVACNRRYAHHYP